ncbi:putative bifunctional diguanylate cyclase/phosphodiesterase [Indiicoccus explosivorum]|uniref:putative bifunctional diguanylate cyclase/phosphodiesterase n=1 Tax=Indiicoccus explosivorum TaxID=1917864 RepID=UPI000B43E1D1|nr:EAL domain-containing protein [Indiicoccus explosivorum]
MPGWTDKLKIGLTGKVVLAVLAVVLVLLCLLGAVATDRYEAYLTEHIEHELLLKSELTALDLSKRLEVNAEIAVQLAERPITEAFLTGTSQSEDPTGNPRYSELNAALTEISENNESIGSVWVTHIGGGFMIADHGQVVEGTLVHRRPWFAEASGAYRPIYSQPYEDLLTSKTTISIVHPVFGDDRRLGFVGLDIHLDAILPVLSSVQSYEQQLVIMTDEGAVVYDPAGLSGEVDVLSLQEGEVEEIRADGERLFAERVVVPDLGWSVATALPAEAALRPIEQLRTFSLLLWLSGAAVMLLALAAALKYLLRDIPILLTDIRRAENPGHRITTAVGRNDEVGAIARAVDRFAGLIHNQVQEMNHRALHDRLTGMPNRLYIEEEITAAIREAEGTDEAVVIAFLDLDRFKQINDMSGHAFGDELLCRFGDRLRASVPSDAFVGRFSGDEFILLLRLSIDDAAAMHVSLGELHAQLSGPYEVRGQLVHTASSFGVAVYPYDAGNKEELLAAADTALAHAKEAGKDRVQFFSSDMKRKFQQQTDVENGLRTAVENGELELYFQPQLCLETGKLTGVESLLRWNHPEKGVLAPGEFIPIAERSGQIAEIDHWVLEESIRRGSALLTRHPEIGTVSVNLNARQLQNRHLPRKIGRLLAFYGFPAAALEIEITESVIADRLGETHRTLHALKTIGITVALDDFGSGYSSLNYLRQLPVDRLKIDRSFISRMEQDTRMQAIVRTVIGLAHSLEMEVVAEGVEQEGELRLLKDWKAEAAQGYLISRPLPYGDLLGFLAARRE